MREQFQLVEQTTEGTRLARQNVWTGMKLVMFKAISADKSGGKYHICYGNAIGESIRNGSKKAPIKVLCGVSVYPDLRVKEGISNVNHKEIRKIRDKPADIPAGYCIKC